MNGEDHHKEAERLLLVAAEHPGGSNEERFALAAAQVHATLATAPEVVTVEVREPAAPARIADVECVPGVRWIDADEQTRSLVIEETDVDDVLINMWVAHDGDGPGVLLTADQVREVIENLTIRLRVMESTP